MLLDEDDFIRRVRKLEKGNYRILAVIKDHQVKALAGFRELENLIHGKFYYVDDLVTAETERGNNMGARLLSEIGQKASSLGFNQVVLDTGLTNIRAQKFYEREGFKGLGLHYIKPVEKV